MALTNGSTAEQVAQWLIAETIRRGYTRKESVAVCSTGYQESKLQMVWSPNRKWYGYFQQDGGYANRMDPEGNARGFLDRLDVKRKNAGASPDPYKNIFWLQQRPSEKTADDAWMDPEARQAYYQEISQWDAKAEAWYSKYSSSNPDSNPTTAPPIGDPSWLPDVLRAAGLTVKEIDGWRDRGHGDFGEIRGIVCHHTGSNNASAESIAFHPELGLASQLHLGRDGVFTMCGQGVAWHAGTGGGYSGRPNSGANQYTIGIEAANDGGGSPGKPHRSSWPDVQYNAYVRGVAAILTKIQQPTSRAIGHKEWAGADNPSGVNYQGKWDPGAIDMNIFRTDVGALIGTVGDDDLSADAEKKIGELHAALLSPKEARGIYATPGEGAKWPWYELLQNVDGSVYMLWVDTLAQDGAEWAVEVVARTAAGKGKDTSKWAVDHATAVLRRAPQSVVAAVLEKV